MVDGLTGSGKSTVLSAVQQWAVDGGHRIFRMSEWKEARPPTYEEIKDYDVYFTYEPSRSWVGAAIRYELSQTQHPYGGEELAHAFALDREILYRRFILPARLAGKTIIQDRGVASSLVYQPVMPRGLTLEQILVLPGNELAFQHPPDALILTHVSAQTAFERIQSRGDESKGVFTQLDFLKLQEQRFASDWLRDLFIERGAQVLYLDTSQTLEQTTASATSLIHDLLTTC